MSERDLTVDRLERTLSSLQDKLKVTMMENTTLKDRLRKVGFLQEESGKLTAELNERTKELQDVVAERDQLKNSLELTQAQVRDFNCRHSLCVSQHAYIFMMYHGMVCTCSRMLNDNGTNNRERGRRGMLVMVHF